MGASKLVVVDLIVFFKSDCKITNDSHFKFFAAAYMSEVQVIIKNLLGLTFHCLISQLLFKIIFESYHVQCIEKQYV